MVRKFFIGLITSTLLLVGLTSATNSFWHGNLVPTSIPVQGSVVAHFDAATTGFSNGQTVTSWVDTVNGITASTTVGTRPTLATNRVNGLPSVQCGGAGGLSIATPGALKTALDSGDYTVFIVFRTLGSKTNGALLAASTGADGSPFYIANGTGVQKFVTTSVIPFAGQTSFSTFGSTSFNSVPTYSNTGQYQAIYINGGAVTSTTTASTGTGSNAITICTNSNNNSPGNSELLDVLFWNVALTPPQYMQAEMWARDKYAQPYPWAALSAFTTFYGDSLTEGVGAGGVTAQPGYLAAQSLSLSFGQYHVIGVGGITVAHMDTLAPTWVDPIPALIGKKTNLVGFEWYNENGANPTPPAPFNHSQTYLANRHAVANQRNVWGTSTGYSSDPSTNRNSYNTSFDATIPNSNIDSYMPFHTNAQIGTSTAYANHPGNWSDTVHLSATGYPFLASDLVSGIQALP